MVNNFRLTAKALASLAEMDAVILGVVNNLVHIISFTDPHFLVVCFQFIERTRRLVETKV